MQTEGWAGQPQSVTASRDQGRGPGICSAGPSRAGVREQLGNADSCVCSAVAHVSVIHPFSIRSSLVCADEPQRNVGLFPSWGRWGQTCIPPTPRPPSHVQCRSAPLCPCPWLPSVMARTRQALLSPAGGGHGCTPPRFPKPQLTLDFLYPHFPGNEDDHEVMGQASKPPPELEGGGGSESFPPCPFCAPAQVSPSAPGPELWCLRQGPRPALSPPSLPGA